MYKEMREAITQFNAPKIFHLLPEKLILTVTEAELCIIVGYSLQFSMHIPTLQKFLNFLTKIQQVEIVGLTQNSSQKIVKNWIIEYFKVLNILQDRFDISTKYINKCLHDRIYTQRDELISKFIQNSSRNQKYGVEIEAWSQNTHLSASLGRSLLQTIYYRYLRGLKLDVKLTDVHRKIIGLILTIIRTQSCIIEEDTSVVIDIFKLTFKLANKFINKKLNSKKLFLVCVEFQFYSLTFHKYLEANLKDFNLKSVYGKSPFINAWAYYSIHLLQLLNVNILLEVLDMFIKYFPEMNDTHAYNVTMAYMDVIKSCQIYLKDFSEKLLELTIENIRNYPQCLEIFKNKIQTLPNYIKDDAKWAYVYLKLTDEEVPKVISDSFKNLQSTEEALHVFRILSNIIPTCEYEELDLILKELSKINLNYEIIEFVIECIKILIKTLDRIDLFNTLEDVFEKLKLMVKVLSGKANEISASKVFNKFWMFFVHFCMQSGQNDEGLNSDLKKIAKVTVWEPTKISINSTNSNHHKLKQKLSQTYGFTSKLSYIELLSVYVNCFLLTLQFDCDFFLFNCLNSSLPLSVQDILLLQYFEHIKSKPYQHLLITNDIKFLVKYLAEHSKRDFIEALLNSEVVSKLHSCYSYQYIHSFSNSDLLIFSLNILGVASTKPKGISQLHHLNDTIHITEPSKFFKFFIKFVKKCLAHALILARNETLFSFSKFVEKSSGLKEDTYAINFFIKSCAVYQYHKVKPKLFYDLLGFHKWFRKMTRKQFLANKKFSNLNLRLTKNEVYEFISNYSSGIGFFSNKNKKMVEGELKNFEFYQEIFYFIEQSFAATTDSSPKSLNLFRDRLLIISAIIANNPNETTLIFNNFHILLLKHLQIVQKSRFNDTQSLIFNYEINSNPDKQPLLSDEYLSLIVKFLEKQFNLCVLQIKNETFILGKVFQCILQRSLDRNGFALLELCIVSMRIAHPLYNLPNSLDLYNLSLRVLMKINPADYYKQADLARQYIKIMKLVLSVPIELIKVSFVFKEALLHVLAVNMFIATQGENKLPSLSREIFDYLADFPDIYKKVSIIYSKIVNHSNPNGENYEEEAYLFSKNPGYSKLLEYLTSPIESSQSFAVKHFIRAPEKTKIFYLPFILKIIKIHNFDIPRTNYCDNILTLVFNMGISSGLCAVATISYIKSTSVYNKSFRSSIEYLLMENIIKFIKKNSWISEDYTEIFGFINNLWLFSEEGNLSKGLQRLLKSETSLYHGLKMTISPDFNIKKVNFNLKVIKNKDFLVLQNEKGKEKFFGLIENFKDIKSASIYFIIKVAVSYLKYWSKVKLVKIQKVELVANRNKDEYGLVYEEIEHGPYEYKDIIESLASYKLILFLLGFKDNSGQVLVSKGRKVILKTGNLTAPDKHFKYFLIDEKNQVDKFRFWVIQFYIILREIFENLSWMLKDEFWKKFKLHFYHSIPIQAAINKISTRITNDNNYF